MIKNNAEIKTHGGYRPGAGRPAKPDEELRKKRTVYLTDDEFPLVKEFIRQLHSKNPR